MLIHTQMPQSVNLSTGVMNVGRQLVTVPEDTVPLNWEYGWQLYKDWKWDGMFMEKEKGCTD